MTDIANIPNLAVPAQTVTNVTLVQPYADNATIGTSFEAITNTDVDTVYPVLVGADIDVVSADAADDGSPAGTGARTVKVTYLDDDFLQATETITMNGTTEVEMTKQTISFIQKAEILTSGSGLAAAGAITIADVTGGGIHQVIDAGARDSGSCHWMIPAGHSGFIHGFWADALPIAAGQGTLEVVLQIAHAVASGVVNSETWRTVARITLIEPDSDIVAATGGNGNNMGVFSFPGNMPFVVPALTRVRLAGKSGSTAAACNAGFSMSVQGSGSGTTVTES
jgi:hypothetical protein